MIVTMIVVLALAATHMFFTAVVNVPYAELKYGPLPGRAADAYTRPFFIQNYRIFAPNPASENRSLWVRAWVEDASGQRSETEWINATAVELADPTRRVLRKQLTILAAERYMAAYRGLNDAQREILASANYHEEGGRERLEAQLASEGDASAYMIASDYAVAYATQVAHALYGEDHQILAVQARVVYNPVIRWNDRFDSDAAAPASIVTHEGWRQPLEYTGQDREAFARTFRDWYEAAGEEAQAR
jgi:predicted metal-dependent hydrolase